MAAETPRGARGRRRAGRVLKWIEQQTGRRNCGQIAVAVVAGVSVEDVERIVGHGKGTKTRTLKFALRQWGYTIPDRSLPMKTPPQLALAQLRSDRRTGWHWIVIDGDKVWDGVWGDEHGVHRPPSHFRITSYLPVTSLRTRN